MSKANRLRTFWSIENNKVVAQAMLDMLEKWRMEQLEKEGNLDPWLSNTFEHTIGELEELKAKPDSSSLSSLLELDSKSLEVAPPTQDYLIEQALKCKDKVTSGDYSGAITNSRTMVEGLLKWILENTEGGYNKRHDGDINGMYKEAANRLGITKEEIAEPLAKLVRGFNSIISGLAELRNSASDSHAVSYRPSKRHAALAVNSAITIVNYFAELCTDQRIGQQG